MSTLMATIISAFALLISTTSAWANPISDHYQSEANGKVWYIFDQDAVGVVIQSQQKPKITFPVKSAPKSKSKYVTLEEASSKSVPKTNELQGPVIILSGEDYAVAKQVDTESMKAENMNLSDADFYTKMAAKHGTTVKRLRELALHAKVVDSGIEAGKIIDKRTGGTRLITEQQLKERLQAVGLTVRRASLTYRGQSEGYFAKLAVYSIGSKSQAAKVVQGALKEIINNPTFAAIKSVSISAEISMVGADGKSTGDNAAMTLDIPRSAVKPEFLTAQVPEPFLSSAQLGGKLWMHPAIREDQ